jgi:hypothetical protein
MARVRIAVVGVGHRGLAVLDRILSHALARAYELEVLLVEPHELGVGVHWRDQPEYLMLNTVASQATAVSDPEMVPGAPIVGGPTFLQWCARRKITTPDGRPVGHDDFLPRKVWGDYLAWSATELLATAPVSVALAVHRGEAREVRPLGSGALLALDDGSQHTVDLAFVTTGHGVRGELPRKAVSEEGIDCYPLPASVAEFPPGARVAVSGMGLSAVDVTAALTVERGGRFYGSDGGIAYRPSGEEPKIILFSRTGRLPCARPARPRRTPRTAARHLTAAALESARARRADAKLDFMVDVWPLIRAEVLHRDLRPPQRRLAESILDLTPQRSADVDAYRRSVIADAELDLAEAELGLEVSAFKEAMEVPRDLRQRLREVVLAPGLTAAGHRDFFAVVPALANHAAVGPQLERVREILALMMAGVVELGPGPAPAVRRDGDAWTLASTHLDRPAVVHADHLVEAHLVWPRSIGGHDRLRSALRSWAQPHPADARYLHLDSANRVFMKDGSLACGVVVLGPPAEGANYYNNYVLWPGAESPMLLEIDAILGPLLDTCASRP